MGCKWIFKKKTDMDGKVHTYKARLVAKGYTQTHRIDYKETFSPVAKIKSIRIMLAITAFHDYEIWQMDVKTAFLNGKLTEDVFMAQLEGFENEKYPKSVSEDESCVDVKVSGSVVVFLVLYVDDILLIGNDIPTLQSVKDWPDVSFALSMVSRHQQNPGEGHWTTLKNILRYLRNTKDRFLVYGEEKGLRVTGYCDAGWQTDKDDSRSQSGWVFLLNGGAVTWKSSKQDTVADSTCESEYIAACEVLKEK
ncbi:retrovirus-related pol polyprotein from transposon TNT 1-94 [Tanacetum coccineum]